MIMCIRSETYETMTTTCKEVSHKALDREKQRKWASQCRPVGKGRLLGLKPHRKQNRIFCVYVLRFAVVLTFKLFTKLS